MSRAQPQPQVKARMRTSEDVYHRLLWSEPCTLWFDVSSVVLGYDDRFLGRREVELSGFAPGGDVPWHRVQYFRSGGKCAIMATDEGKTATITPQHWPRGATLLWSREGRIDRVCTAQHAPDGGHQGTTSSPGTLHSFIEPHHRFQLIPSHHFDSTAKAWQPTSATSTPPSPSPLAITVVSYNVLDDRYSEGAANCNQRWTHLIALLATLDADVIALQEVTPRFLALLQACHWVRAQYHMSDTAINDTAHTLDPSGLLTLSKVKPVQLHYRQQDNKRQLLAAFELSNSRLLFVANVHLTSDHHRSNAAKRQTQLSSLMDACAWESGDGRAIDVVVLGDTNMQDAEAVPEDYGDACDRVGSTYDPVTNLLAARISRSGRCGRYDRVFIRRSRRCHGLALQVARAELVGTEPVNSMFLSDHYGVCCRLECAAASSPRNDLVLTRRYPPLPTSAVALLLPKALWPALQSIREKHDPAFHRWPPHINLLYGFVGSEYLSDACAVLRSVCAPLAPFTISLGALQLFRHRTSSTVYAAVQDAADGVKRLQKALQAAFPLCIEQSGHSAEGFTPHCTVARLTSNVSSSLKEWSVLAETWLGHPIPVTRLAVLVRSGDEPFRVFDRIALGTDAQRHSISSDGQQTTPQPEPSATPTVETNGGGHAPDATWQVDTQPDDKDVLFRFLTTRDVLCCRAEETERQRLAKTLVSACQAIILDACGARADDAIASCAHVVGSSGLSAQLRSSDIDILVCGPSRLSVRDFFAALREKVSSAWPSSAAPCHVRLVFDALVPVAIISHGGLQVDVSYAQYTAHRSPLHVQPWSLSASDLRLMDAASSRAVGSVLDMGLVQKAVPHVRRSAFVTALRVVRHWADMRGLAETKLGYLAGHSWTLLMTYACQQLSARPDQLNTVTSTELLMHFFQHFSRWTWPTAVTLTPLQRQHSLEVMSILSPSYPHRNTARGVSRSTLHRLRAELTHAAERLAGPLSEARVDEAELLSTLSELCQPPLFEFECSSCIELLVRGADGDSTAACSSFVESRLHELVADLDKLDLLAAPHRPTRQPDPCSRQLLIGMSRVGSLSSAVLQEVQRFIRRCEAGLARDCASAAHCCSIAHKLTGPPMVE